MDSQKVSFYNEISLMMFGFGDSHKPNPDTVRLVESIVLKQLRTIIQEALKYSDGKNLNGTELVFLMRHDKWKMRRFVKYLKNRELKKVAMSVNSPVVEVDLDSKPKNELMEFIEYIDETGEFTNLTELDEVKQQRLLRADRISQLLNEEKYLEFCKARCASFSSNGIGYRGYRNTDRLRLWVDPKKEINFQIPAVVVLSYLAYQTVAEITDYALLVRMDTKCTSDVVGHLSGCYYNSTMFNGEHRFNGSNLDYSRVYNNQPPISVNEIKEVMRRVSSPQAGVLNFGGKLPETHYLFAL